MDEGQERYIIKIEQQGGKEVVKIYDQIKGKAIDTSKQIDKAAKEAAKSEIKAAKEVVKANEEKAAAVAKAYAKIQREISAKTRTAQGLRGGKSESERNLYAQTIKQIGILQQKQKALYDEQKAYADETARAKTTIDQLSKVVGATEEKQASFRTELRNTIQEAAELLMIWRNMTDEQKKSADGIALKKKINELTEKAGDLKDAMADVNREVTGKASDTRTFSAVSEGLDTVISLYGVAQGAMAAYGVSEQELMAMQTKFQAILTASNALKTIQNNLQQQSNLMVGVAAIKNWALAKAEAAATSATKGHTLAQMAFNAVAKMNPYVILATAAASVVGAMVWYTKANKDAKEVEKKRAEQVKRTAEEEKKKAETIGGAIADTISKYRKLQMQWKELQNTAQKTKWIKDNASEFSSLNLAIKGVNDADKVFITQSSQVIKALTSRARANATSKLYEEAYAKKVKNDVNGSVANGRYSKKYTYKTELSSADKDYLASKGFKTTWQSRAVNQDQLNALNAKAKADAQAKNDAEDAMLKKYEEAMKKAEEAAFKDEGALGNLSSGPGGSGGGDTKERKKKDFDEIEKLELQHLENMKKIVEGGQMQIREGEASQMREGFAKQRALLDIEYDKTINEANEKAAAWLKQIQKDEEDIWKANNPNAEADGKKFSPTTTELPQEMMALIEGMKAQAMIAWANANEQINQNEEASWNDYLMKFGNYQERRLAIVRSYNEQMEAAQGDKGKTSTLLEGLKNELDELDEKFGLVASDFAELFADASVKSVGHIQKIIEKYTALTEYMKGGGMTGAGGSMDKLKSYGFDEKTISKIQSDPEKLKAVTDQIEKLKALLADKSPFESFYQNVKKAIEEMKNGGDPGTMVQSVVGEMRGVLGQAKGAAGDIGTIFGVDTDANSAIGKAFTTAEGVLSVGEGIGKFMSGDFVGGIMGGISGIAQLVTVFGGSNMAEMQKKMDDLKKSNELLSGSMESLTKKMNDAAAEDVVSVRSEMEKNMKTQISNYQQMMIANSHKWENGSRSIASKFTKNNKGLMGRIGGVVGKNISTFSDILTLTPEEMSKLKNENTALYKELLDAIDKVTNKHTGQGMSDMLTEYTNFAGKMEEITQQSIEKLSLLAEGSLTDEFKSMLADMDVSVTDFAESMNEKLRAAIVSSVVDSKFSKRLEEIREKIAKGMEDGTLTEAEVQALVDEYNNIAQGAISSVNEAYDKAGLGKLTDQSFSHEAAASVTQETMDEVNGRLTAVQVSLQTMALIAQQSQLNLTNIEKYTSYLPSMSKDMAAMRSSIETKL